MNKNRKLEKNTGKFRKIRKKQKIQESIKYNNKKQINTEKYKNIQKNTKKTEIHVQS